MILLKIIIPAGQPPEIAMIMSAPEGFWDTACMALPLSVILWVDVQYGDTGTYSQLGQITAHILQHSVSSSKHVQVSAYSQTGEVAYNDILLLWGRGILLVSHGWVYPSYVFPSWTYSQFYWMTLWFPLHSSTMVEEEKLKSWIALQRQGLNRPWRLIFFLHLCET